MKRLPFDFLPAVVASVGLLAFAGLFLGETASFRKAVVSWAERDLKTRTELAAETLEEPLRTGDFRRIHAFGDACAADGVRLTVLVGERGVFFDSVRKGESVPESLYAAHPCGEYMIRLGLPRERVLAPFNRARLGFLLSALLGGTGVLLVFFTTYRQRVRIRELDRLERFRRDFIADVSHEIKTPLTGILGAAEMLSESGASESQRPLLSMISKESTRLNALVQQILDLARLEREGEALDLAETDLVDLARESVDLMRPRAEAAGIALSFVAPEAPCVAKVDARLIGEAVGNLVSNAIRHSGSPDVAVSVSRTAQGFAIAVEDHGIGIPPEHAERVFERFHRVDPARAAESGGAGLGLAIARRIARLHGGDVVLSPVAPSGCRFSLSVESRQ